MFRIRDAQLGDVLFIGLHMRKQDEEEVWYSNHFTPLQALVSSYSHSPLYRKTIEWHGSPVGMFGVGTTENNPNLGSPWFLAADNFEEWKVPFLKASKRVHREMHEVRPILANAVYHENIVSMKWLVWSGYEVDIDPIPWGPEHKLFNIFWSTL